MSAQSNAPIIIKRKKVSGGDGHHGGAWKVAYADFVTAMMAFFMLMWLLNATTEKQRKGLADYFNPTIPILRVSGGGDGAFGGDDIMSEATLARNGTGATQKFAAERHNARGDSGIDESSEDTGLAQAEQEFLDSLEEQLSARSGESTISDGLARHITTRVTDEGLVVEVFDLPDAPLFRGETAEPTLVMRQITEMISSVFALATNEVAVNGYVRSMPVVLANNPVWDVSNARADSVRRLMEDEGLGPNRFQRITGFADRKPLVSNQMAVRNNRIELILLRENR